MVRGLSSCSGWRLGTGLLAFSMVILASGCMWGIVTDASTGGPVPGALVQYTHNEGRYSEGWTDANGIFVFTEMHGGQVGVQSTLGEGTTFTATLPALEPADGSPGRQTTVD